MDIRTMYDNLTGRCDWAIQPPGLATDDGLDTAVIISLFTDRRADPDDELPDGGTDRRGWWGDDYAEVEDDRIGSRLWLLERSKLLPETARRAREYVQEALEWLIDDKVASAVDVAAEIFRPQLLALTVEIHRPGRPVARFRFEKYWGGTDAI